MSDNSDLSTRIGLTGDDEVRAKLQQLGTDGAASFGKIGAAADASTARIQAAYARLAQSVDPAAKAQARIAQGQDTLNAAFGRGLISQDQYDKTLQQLTSRWTSYASAAAAGARGIEGVERLARSGIENLSRGDYAGAIARIGLLTAHISGATIAAVALGAAFIGIPGAVVAAAQQSEIAIQRIRNAVTVSGGASGLTPGAIAALAPGLNASTTLSLAGARTALTGFVGAGLPESLIAPAARLLPDFAAATGVGNDDAQHQLLAMLADPAKAADALVNSFHALDTAGARQIQNLAEQGRVEQADKLIIDALSRSLAGTAQQSETTLERIGTFFSDLWSGLGNAGRQATGGATVEEQLALARSGQSYVIGDTPVYVPPDQAAASDLARRKAVDDLVASLRGQEAQQERLIDQGAALALSYQPADAATLLLSNQLVKLDDAGKAAADQLKAASDALAAGLASPDMAQKLQVLQQIVTSIDNAASNVGRAAGNQKSPLQIQLEALTAQGAAISAPERDRAIAQARAAIEEQYQSNLRNPQVTQSDADAVRQQALANLGASTDNIDRDLAARLTAATAALSAQAAAYGVDAAAAERARIAGEAEAAYLTGATRDRQAYEGALLRQAEAQHQLAAAQAEYGAHNDLAASQNLLGASANGPAALRAAEIANQARGSAIQIFGTDQTAEAQKLIADLTQINMLRDQNNRLVAANDEDRQLQQTLAEKTLELSLMTQDAGLRAQELADLRTRNELINQGYQVGTQAFTDELAKRTAINVAIAQADVEIQRVQNTQREWTQDAREAAGIVTNAFEDMTIRGKNFRDTVKDIENQLVQLIDRIFIEQPLQNAIVSLFGGKPQSTSSGLDLLSALAGKIGIGNLFSTAGGNDGGSDFGLDSAFAAAGSLFPEAKGDAFDRSGRVPKYFAEGGIFGAATLFSIANGGGLGVLGERGPEAVMPLARLPGGSLGVRSAGGGQGGDSHYYIDARGATPGVEDKIANIIRYVQGIDASIEKRAVSAVAAAGRSNPRLFTNGR